MKDQERRCQYTKSVKDSQSVDWPWQILYAGHGVRTIDQMARALGDITADHVPVTHVRTSSVKRAKEILRPPSKVALLLLHLTQSRSREWIDLAAWVRQESIHGKIQIAACCSPFDRDTEKNLLEAGHLDDVIAWTPDDHHSLKMLAIKAFNTVRRTRNQSGRQIQGPPDDSRETEKKTAVNTLVEEIGDLIWETGPTHAFAYVSPAAKTLWGYPADHLIGQPFGHAMAREIRSDAWTQIHEAMGRREEFTNTEISRTHKSGAPRYFLTSGRPFFDPSGKWAGYRGIEKDITALVQAEQEKKTLIAQLRQAQRLEAIGSLAGGIAHDFNNILGGILGYTQLIQYEIRNNPVVLTHTRHIISGCNRAKNLILQILDFSRQRESTRPSRVTMPGEIVADAVKLLRASIPSSIKIKTQIRKDAGPILADGSQILQAVMNLCTNARQAIESGQGCITVRVTRVRLTPENHTRGPELDLEHGDYVTIAVSDTGKGIESNTLEKIFNPYFTTQKRGDGTGLGLSVVHGIAARFNGTVGVETVPGRGSTFTLYFPRCQRKPLPEKETRFRLMEGKAKVLFVDDEPMLVDIGRMMLERLGYQVTALEHPFKALDMIRSDPSFDLLITDMTMPDILGTQLAVRAKQINPGLSVVLATGFSNIVQTQKANPSGIDAVLAKPITMASLSQTLHQLLSG